MVEQKMTNLKNDNAFTCVPSQRFKGKTLSIRRSRCVGAIVGRRVGRCVFGRNVGLSVGCGVGLGVVGTIIVGSGL